MEKAADPPIHAFERIINKKMPILFLGEGKYSFSTAIAIMRKGWSDILATNLIGEKPVYSELIVQQVKNILDDDTSTSDAKIDRIRVLMDLSEEDHEVEIGVNATSLSTTLCMEKSKDDQEVADVTKCLEDAKVSSNDDAVPMKMGVARTKSYAAYGGISASPYGTPKKLPMAKQESKAEATPRAKVMMPVAGASPQTGASAVTGKAEKSAMGQHTHSPPVTAGSLSVTPGSLSAGSFKNNCTFQKTHRRRIMLLFLQS